MVGGVCNFSLETISQYIGRKVSEEGRSLVVVFAHWTSKGDIGERMSNINDALRAMTVDQKKDFITSFLLNWISPGGRQVLQGVFGPWDWILDHLLSFARLDDGTQFLGLISYDYVVPFKGLILEPEIVFMVEGSKELVDEVVSLVEKTYIAAISSPSREWVTSYQKKLVLE